MDLTAVSSHPQAPAAGSPPTDDRSERFWGLLLLLIGFGGFVAWAVLAPIGSAAVAPGLVAVETSRKTVQHLEGGVVAEILVREGDKVEQDQVLLRLDDTEAHAQLEIVSSQYLAARTLEASLIAERDGLPEPVFPEDLTAIADNPRVAEAISAQVRWFRARRQALDGEVAVLRQRIEQLHEQVAGLDALEQSKTKRIGLYAEELDGLLKLFDKGLGDKSRLREWERLSAELEGERAEHRAAIAAARVQVGETELQIAQVQQRFLSEVVGQLRDAQTELADLRQRRRALEKTLERTDIRAPVAGAVVDMQVHTLGGVVRPGERILDLIPEGEPLLVEARVQPNDIDRVAPGLEADIRFSAFNAATTPTIPGRVLTISADSLTDPATQEPYFLARIEVTAEGIEKLTELVLLPGMPAEVIIKTGERTFFEYLVRPFTDRMMLAFRED